MTGQIKIREGVAADAPALALLLAQLGYPGVQPFLERRIQEQLAHPDALLLVACSSARVIGFVSLHVIAQLALAGDFCRVSYLCVDEGVRSLGVGALLEQCAERHAREHGCDRIELHSNVRRVDAHRFYARVGYEESPKYLVKRLR
jgi:GNAT superfamily N-acetyltransferase